MFLSALATSYDMSLTGVRIDLVPTYCGEASAKWQEISSTDPLSDIPEKKSASMRPEEDRDLLCPISVHLSSASA